MDRHGAHELRPLAPHHRTGSRDAFEAVSLHDAMTPCGRGNDTASDATLSNGLLAEGAMTLQ